MKTDKKKKHAERLTHTFPPVFDPASRVLILGTFPSPKSRENGFYYGHPQNRFWSVMSAVLECPVPVTVSEKTAFLLENHIALWDVVKSCDITGADDTSIKNIVANDIGYLLRACDIRAVFTTGKTATALYARYCPASGEMPSVGLPSTSPANCRYFTMNELTARYNIIKQFI